MRFVRSTTSCLILFAMLFASVLPQSGWVFCIESDGNVSLEAGNVSGRCTDTDSAPLQLAVIAHAESHCGDCLDQSIDTDTTRRAVSDDAPDTTTYSSEADPPLQLASSCVRRKTAVRRPPTRSVHLLNAAFLL
jgi:hypothetical protein